MSNPGARLCQGAFDAFEIFFAEESQKVQNSEKVPISRKRHEKSKIEDN
jgi:hypothetical protein